LPKIVEIRLGFYGYNGQEPDENSDKHQLYTVYEASGADAHHHELGPASPALARAVP
jgi:hypothetical protein